MLNTVKLYGALGEKFGKEFHFDIESPAEAIAALKATVPGFTEHLTKFSEPGYHVFIGDQDLSKDDMLLRTDKVIKIVPAVAGGGGVFKIILGIVLIIVGFFCGGCTTSFGVSLLISGIAQILFAPPKPKAPGQRESSANQPSYSFDGPVNTSQQGNPVPVGYGKLLVGGQVVAAGLYVDSI